ncbi:acyl-CoA carboxylase subunit epsilon [Streptomyces sp. NPDC093510]|uniref:acyl-CoA carboxylase subunit epsilon n=1 Tax=Streptomyces sp. NPDC093510 TaxID=3155199 RepID=UPI0034305ACE
MRGCASEAELAAVTVTLLSLASGGRAEGRVVGGKGQGSRAGWRPSVPAGVYRAPLSWR